MYSYMYVPSARFKIDNHLFIYYNKSLCIRNIGIYLYLFLNPSRLWHSRLPLISDSIISQFRNIYISLINWFTQMDNFCVPKKFNRHVVKALTILHNTLVQSVFFPIESIVKQVERQMRRTKRLENIEDCVQKSLCSLTRLGVVARVGASDYALRQALQFSSGESAIPWETVPKVPKRVSRRSIA